MKKPILLLLLCTFLWSCDEYEVVDNSRLVFSGKVVDQAGNPLPGRFVYLEGIDGAGGTMRSENLGDDFTNNDGEFHFASLKTSTNNLHINRPMNLDYYHFMNPYAPFYKIGGPIDSIYTSVDYFDIPESTIIATAQLRKRSFFRLKIEHTSSTTNDTLHWSLSYTHAICAFYYKNGRIIDEKSTCYETFLDNQLMEQTPSQPNFEYAYRSVIGGTVKLTYQINDQPEQKISLSLDQPHESYILQY